MSSIHILDSVGEAHGQPGVDLAERLKKTLRHSFPVYYHFVLDRNDLAHVFRGIQSETEGGGVPIVHIEAHGDKEGIELRNKKMVGWLELAALLRPINLATRFNLLVGLSCCDGLSQILILREDKMCPFAGIVACEGTANTPDLLEGFGQFYEILVNEGKASKATNALGMQLSGNSPARCMLFTAERAYRRVRDEVFKENRDPNHRAEDVQKYRRMSDLVRARKGDPRPASLEEIEGVIDNAERNALERYFHAFFGTAEIPENAERYGHLLKF